MAFPFVLGSENARTPSEAERADVVARMVFGVFGLDVLPRGFYFLDTYHGTGSYFTFVPFFYIFPVFLL